MTLPAAIIAARPPRARVGRADLARLLGALSDDAVPAAVTSLGYTLDSERAAAGASSGRGAIADASSLPGRPGSQAPMRLYVLDELRFTPEARQRTPPRGKRARGKGALTRAEVSPSEVVGKRLPDKPPLLPWARLWPALRRMLGSTRPSRDPDVPAVLRALGRGEVLARIPCRVRHAWSGRASVWLDRSARLAPLWGDQDEVCSHLVRVCGRAGVAIRVLDGFAQASSIRRRGDLLAGFRPDATSPVLVLSDLGSCARGDVERDAWQRTGLRLRREGVRLSALLPGAAGPLSPSTMHAFVPKTWEGAAAGRRYRPASPDDRARRVGDLLVLVSPVAYLQPGLLRALRLLLPRARADGATEVDLWSHADVRAATSTGLVLHAEAARRLRERFAPRPDDPPSTDDFAPPFGERLRNAVSRLIAEWHQPLSSELLHAESVIWSGLAPGRTCEPSVSPPSDHAAAITFFGRLRATARSESADPLAVAEVRRFCGTLLPGLSDDAYRATPGLDDLWLATRRDVPGERVPATIDERKLAEDRPRPAEPGWWAVRQVGADLVFSPSETGPTWPSAGCDAGSPVALLLAANREVRITRETGDRRNHPLESGLSIPLGIADRLELATDCCEGVVRSWSRESWATAAGRDRYGLWADMKLGKVAQRFRLIPPGFSWIGSHEDEAGRYSDEGPRHRVFFTRARWLADTPVTQALWTAVMGKNPSRFPTPDRPVEQVSWEDCQEFMRKLGARIGGLAPRLPTEREWEFACRAGTEEATWVGNLEILGQHNAPRLDAIAWYGGNCGVDFELDDGWAIGSWPEKAHEHAKGGTHPVGQKAPNPVGLYDMLGNVLEWCADGGYSKYRAGTEVDPPAEPPGSYRALRGGSWYSYAGFVRTARRDASTPASRDDNLGFRLARGQGPGGVGEPAARSDDGGSGGGGAATGARPPEAMSRGGRGK